MSDFAQYKFRMPVSLKRLVCQAADDADRTMSAELIKRLEESFGATSTPASYTAPRARRPVTAVYLDEVRADFAVQLMSALIAEPENIAGAPFLANVLTQDLQDVAPETPDAQLYAAASVMLADALIAELQKVPA